MLAGGSVCIDSAEVGLLLSEGGRPVVPFCAKRDPFSRCRELIAADKFGRFITVGEVRLLLTQVTTPLAGNVESAPTSLFKSP